MPFGCDPEHVLDGDCFASRILDASGEAIVVTDPAGNIVDVNAVFCATSGYARSELLGQNPRLLKSDRHDPTFYQHMWDSLIRSGYWQDEIWDRRKNGEVFPKLLTITALRNHAGKVTHYVGFSADISIVRRRTEDLERLAHFDPLTGLPNRILFLDRLRQAMGQARRSERNVAVLFIDLDGFKKINDSMGHVVGDRLLVAVGERLASSLRTTDTVSRHGGDEFTIVLPEIIGAEDAVPVARKIVGSFSAPFILGDREVTVGASVGVAIFPDDADTVDFLLGCADAAMYRAKDDGRGTYRFYSPEMHRRAVLQAQLEQDLRSALDRGEFTLLYQPQVHLRTGLLTGVEALVRWRHPREGLLPPAKFVPLAEQLRLIASVDDWVMGEAVRQARRWGDGGLPAFRVAVNLSAQQLERPGFPNRVAKLLVDSGLEPHRLEAEITETQAMRNPERTLEVLQELRAIGVRIAIDDFGTGHSAFAYLKRFPVDVLKIDRSFVRDIETDPAAAAITTSLIALAHDLRITVIAEGVETTGQLAFLRERGCDEVQGFLTGRPVPAEVAAEFADGRRHPSIR